MIQWEEGKFVTQYGYVGNIRLFSVHWSSTRHADGKMHLLTTDLPGFSHVAEKDRFKTAEEAKEKAERIMASFLRYVQDNWKSEIT